MVFAGASSSTGQTEPAQPGCGAFSVPGSYALAHRIIAGWLGGRRRQLPSGSWREVPIQHRTPLLQAHACSAGACSTGHPCFAAGHSCRSAYTNAQQ